MRLLIGCSDMQDVLHLVCVCLCVSVCVTVCVHVYVYVYVHVNVCVTQHRKTDRKLFTDSGGWCCMAVLSCWTDISTTPHTTTQHQHNTTSPGER